MKNIKLNIAIILAGLFLTVSASCDDQGYDDYDAGHAPTQAMNGEWWIDIIDEATGEVLVPHALHTTYDNNGTLYISDRIFADVNPPLSYSGWWLETPLQHNINDLTFSATNQVNQADQSVVTITEGRIIKNGGHTQSGAVADSIVFRGVFDYDPGTTLLFAGHRRTGFTEDEF
jgi:hypothetical protein